LEGITTGSVASRKLIQNLNKNILHIMGACCGKGKKPENPHKNGSTPQPDPRV